MGERSVRNAEVVGSIPICYTMKTGCASAVASSGFDLGLKTPDPRLVSREGRARRGGSGALLPAIRYSGVEFPAEVRHPSAM